MTVRQKQGFVGISLVGLLVAAVLGANLLVSQGAAQPAALRVTLVAQGMAFARADANEESNPTLALPAGQWVEIELRNEDPGSRHNLIIPELKLQTRLLQAGESAVLRFRVPASGRLTYYCELHPMMMRGEIRLRD
jgi:plastocyanin